MKRKEFLILLAAATGLVLVLFLLPGEKSSSRTGAILSDVRLDAIQKIKLELKDQAIELQRDGSVWVLPSRFGYPADPNKVNSLILKLLDVAPAQMVTDLPAKYDKLGVGESSLQEGYSQVSLLASDNAVLGGFKLGASRRQRGDEFSAGASGQFIRRLGRPEVYTMPQPIALAVDSSEWINGELLSVLSDDVLDIQTFTLEGDVVKPDFELRRNGSDAATVSEFKYVGTIESGKEVQPSVVSQVGSVLENFRIVDALLVGSEEEKKLPATTRRLVVLTKRGLKYTVGMMLSEGKHFLQFRASLDPETVTLAQQAKPQSAELASSPVSLNPGASSSASSLSASSLSASSLSSAVATKAATPVNVATEAEVETLNAQFQKWVYQVAPFQGKKFEVQSGDLIKVKQAPVAGAAPGLSRRP